MPPPFEALFFAVIQCRLAAAYFCERGHLLLRSVDTCTSPSSGRASLA